MTAAQEREAEQVSLAYQAALARLGASATAEALDLWQAVPTPPPATAAQRWLSQALTLLLSRRRRAVALGRAYYRLTRALLTGRTVTDPDRKESGSVTLGELRSQFAALSGGATRVDPSTGEVLESPERSTGGRDDDTAIPLDPGFANDQAAERAARQEAITNLTALGPNNLSRLLEKISDEQPAKDADKARTEAHTKAGARQAAALERVVINGARSSTWQLQEGDTRALGYVRISRTGTPCGWCAMLISRGFVEKRSALYRSAKAGGGDGTDTYEDADKYHDNCKCIAIPVFSKAQMASDPLFALNRKYAVQWPQVTDGVTDKLSAWRNFIRREQAGARRTTSDHS